MSATSNGNSANQWLAAGLILVIGMPIALWVVSCSGESDSDAPDPAEAAQQEFLWIERAKDEVRAKLKDPKSADFRNAAVRRQSGSPLVCGEVNGKNSFGGMTGYQRFIFMGSAGTVMEEEMAVGEFHELWSRVCLR